MVDGSGQPDNGQFISRSRESSSFGETFDAYLQALLTFALFLR
jgi:hypothetical protein